MQVISPLPSHCSQVAITLFLVGYSALFANEYFHKFHSRPDKQSHRSASKKSGMRNYICDRRAYAVVQTHEASPDSILQEKVIAESRQCDYFGGRRGTTGSRCNETHSFANDPHARQTATQIDNDQDFGGRLCRLLSNIPNITDHFTTKGTRKRIGYQLPCRVSLGSLRAFVSIRR